MGKAQKEKLSTFSIAPVIEIQLNSNGMARGTLNFFERK